MINKLVESEIFLVSGGDGNETICYQEIGRYDGFSGFALSDSLFGTRKELAVRVYCFLAFVCFVKGWF